MPTISEETIGKLVTPVGATATTFETLLCDSNGAPVLVLGYDGTNYHVLKCNASRQLEVVMSGKATDSDKLDGLDSTAFLQLTGGTMSGHISQATNPTNDDHLARKGYVDTEVAGAGACAGPTIWNPFSPPSSAHALDDEFNDASIDGKWTEWDEGNNLTGAETATGLELTQTTEAAVTWAGYYQDVPSGDYAAWAAFAFSTIQEAHHHFGLALLEDADDNPATCDLYTYAIEITGTAYVLKRRKYSDYDTYVGENNYITFGAPGPNLLFLRIRKQTANYYLDYSFNGIGWRQAGGATLDFTPEQIAVVCANAGANTHKMTCLFFRVLAGTIDVTQTMGGRRVHLCGYA